MTFGWDVFNDDSLYKSYFKRTKNLQGNQDQNLTKEERENLLV
jgi:hypothetical protein